MSEVLFARRPGGSPAIAALLAVGTIRRDARVLDICCGEGEDSLLLACGGLTGIVGVDNNPDCVRAAQETAKQHKLPKKTLEFRKQNVWALLKKCPSGSIDVVIDTLGARNITEDDDARPDRRGEKGERRFAVEIARVLADKGLWLAHVRDDHRNRRPYATRPASKLFPTGAADHFDLRLAYPTHLAEYAEECEACGKRKEKLEEEFALHLGEVYFAIARRKSRSKTRAGT